MAHDIDESIATYLTGLRVEGKADRTISTYAETLRDFRRVGRKLDLPDTVEAYEIEHAGRYAERVSDHVDVVERNVALATLHGADLCAMDGDKRRESFPSSGTDSLINEHRDQTKAASASDSVAR